MAFLPQDCDALNIIKDHVKKTWYNNSVSESWRKLPEVPDQAEIMPAEEENKCSQPENWFQYQIDPEYENAAKLPTNTITGPWASKSEYIGAHYQILREDAVASLRKSVREFKKHPEMNDSQETCIYTSVHFKGFQLGALGAGFRIEFSYDRARKQIRWEQSKRLVQGTVVALSPQRDFFRSICKVCVVAARPIVGGLDQNPPQIDLFWGNSEDAVFDPVEPYVMVEARSGYFEASRHMLVALQKLETERFNLANNLVDLDNDVKAPEYLEDQPFMDLSVLSGSEEDSLQLQNVNVLEKFPEIPSSGMDSSQMLACERMLTKRIAIVQGPPGTGKTFVSVSALRAMLANLAPHDPPILVAAQTNHALDQLLNHVLSHEPNILRLGGRCDKDNKQILKRTLFELRRTTKHLPSGCKGNKGYGKLKARVEEIKTAMKPLLDDKLLTAETLLHDGLITKEQYDSLFADAGWQIGDDSGRKGLEKWLNGQVEPIPRAPSINFGLPLEETDLDFEQLQEVELEAEGDEGCDALRGNDDKEALRGTWIPFRRKFTGKFSVSITVRRVKKHLEIQDLYRIPLGHRGELYRYFEMLQNEIMLKALRAILKEYEDTVDSIRSTKWLNDTRFVKHLGIKLIGCTTTGLSKYRGFLAALKPRTLLIEEAAETLEGKIMAGMIESIQQLILVGDHQQLQAHCNIQSLEDRPYFMAKSMFERLVDNSMEYTMLNEQRRMISDIRQLLCIRPNPFYQNLRDHPSVLDRVNVRPPVEGMGSYDTYWFTHEWGEARGDDCSRYNSQEAEMVAGFFKYLTLNGVETSKITVLTFYNGQRKALLMALKNVFGKGANTFFHVHTIDGYQGEENDIILLSLVRSNLRSDIGFMDNRNRLVVALSRARRGLYIFGNSANMVANESSEEIIGRDPLWMPLIEFMRSQGRFDYDKGLPITCRKHNKTIRYNNPDQWLGNAGGCDKKCGGSLFCGHPCAYTCHPFDHDRIVCQIPCEKILLCGHGCAKYCGEQCECSKCEQFYDDHSGDLISTVLDSAVFKGNSKKNAIRNGRSRSSLASPSRRVMFEDSSDIRNEIRSLSVPSTAHTPRSRKGFASPRSPAKSSLGQHSFSTPPNNPWHDWDATLADEDLAEQLRNLDALAPKPDPSILVYKDIHRPVTVENGERVISSSVERIVPRTEVAASQSFENKALKKLNGRGALQYANSDFDVDTFEAVIGRKVPAHLLKRLREASLDNVEVAVNMYFDQCSGPKSLLPPFQYSAVGYTPAEDEECFGCGAERSMLSHPHSFGRCQYCQKMYCCFCLNKCKCLRSTALRSAAPLSPVLEVDCGVNQVSPISDLYDVSPREIERQRQAAHSRRMATGSSATTDIRPPSSASATPVIQVPSPSSAPTEQTTTKSDDEPEGDLMSFD